ALAAIGEIEVSVGTGLPVVKFCAFDAPPPGVGLKTLIAKVFGFTTYAAGTCTVNCVAVCVNGVRSAWPCHWTTEDATKFVPVNVSVNPNEPATTFVGDSAVSVGTGLLIVNVCAAVVPPPGVGLKTVTLAVPYTAM